MTFTLTTQAPGFDWLGAVITPFCIGYTISSLFWFTVSFFRK